MKQERGPIHLLVLLEIVILVLVSVLGVVESLKPKAVSEYNEDTGVEENVITELPTEIQNTEENTEIENIEEYVMESEIFSVEVEEKAASMTLEEKVAQIFIVSPETLTNQDGVTIAGNGTKNAINQYPIGGMVYSHVNYQGDRQVRALLSGAEEFIKERNGLYLWLLAAESTSEGNLSVAMSRNYEAAAISKLLEKEGKVQSAQSDENILIPVHFPENKEAVSEESFCIILSNAADTEITGQEGIPCSLSNQAVRYLRSDLNFHGMIMTDSLSADVITSSYSVGEAAVQAVQAGADLIYQPQNFEEAYQAVLDAVNAGEISMERLDQAVKHILEQKLLIPEPKKEDTAVNSNKTNKNNTANQNTANHNTADTNPVSNESNGGAEAENPAANTQPTENTNPTPENTPAENPANQQPAENGANAENNAGEQNNAGGEANPGGDSNAGGEANPGGENNSGENQNP